VYHYTVFSLQTALLLQSFLLLCGTHNEVIQSCQLILYDSPITSKLFSFEDSHTWDIILKNRFVDFVVSLY
jgi:hypothetical protein